MESADAATTGIVVVDVDMIASVMTAVVVDTDVDTIEAAVAAADAVDSKSGIVNVKMSQRWCSR